MHLPGNKLPKAQKKVWAPFTTEPPQSLIFLLQSPAPGICADQTAGDSDSGHCAPLPGSGPTRCTPGASASLASNVIAILSSGLAVRKGVSPRGPGAFPYESISSHSGTGDDPPAGPHAIPPPLYLPAPPENPFQVRAPGRFLIHQS